MCEKRQTKTTTRDVLHKRFAGGRQSQAAKHRLALCLRATDCHRLCEQLVKAPGKASVYCVDIETGEKTELYPALEDPAFACPKGLF